MTPRCASVRARRRSTTRSRSKRRRERGCADRQFGRLASRRFGWDDRALEFQRLSRDVPGVSSAARHGADRAGRREQADRPLWIGGARIQRARIGRLDRPHGGAPSARLLRRSKTSDDAVSRNLRTRCRRVRSLRRIQRAQRAKCRDRKLVSDRKGRDEDRQRGCQRLRRRDAPGGLGHFALRRRGRAHAADSRLSSRRPRDVSVRYVLRPETRRREHRERRRRRDRCEQFLPRAGEADA